MQFHATVRCHTQSLSLLALVDSGADDSFLDAAVASQMGITLESLNSPMQVKVGAT